jgi:hypothetical protein
MDLTLRRATTDMVLNPWRLVNSVRAAEAHQESNNSMLKCCHLAKELSKLSNSTCDSPSKCMNVGAKQIGIPSCGWSSYSCFMQMRGSYEVLDILLLKRISSEWEGIHLQIIFQQTSKDIKLHFVGQLWWCNGHFFSYLIVAIGICHNNLLVPAVNGGGGGRKFIWHWLTQH